MKSIRGGEDPDAAKTAYIRGGTAILFVGCYSFPVLVPEAQCGDGILNEGEPNNNNLLGKTASIYERTRETGTTGAVGLACLISVS